MPNGNTDYDLEDRLLNYSERVIRVVDSLPDSLAGRHIAGQLLRCGTSPFANHGEAQAAESRNDFIHKLGVCYKKCVKADGGCALFIVSVWSRQRDSIRSWPKQRN